MTYIENRADAGRKHDIITNRAGKVRDMVRQSSSSPTPEAGGIFMSLENAERKVMKLQGNQEARAYRYRS